MGSAWVVALMFPNIGNPYDNIEELTQALNEAVDEQINMVQSNCDAYHSLYRGLTHAIGAREAGRDEVAWAAIRKIAEVIKRMELETQLVLTEMRQA